MARKASFDRDTALKQAMDLFWSKGFHATSLKDIEAALDMRPGSIYAAFESKEQLFQSALELYSARARAALEDTLAAAPTPLVGLASHVRNLGRAMEGAVPSRACMLMKTVLETPDNDTDLRAAAEDMLRHTEQIFSSAFGDAKEQKQMAPGKSPARLAARLQSDILGLRAYAQRSDTAGQISALADDIARDIEALAV
ncbi:MAG: helix-turn-helix domain-containing protein [Pseudomonadota bacterium]